MHLALGRHSVNGSMANSRLIQNGGLQNEPLPSFSYMTSSVTPFHAAVCSSREI